MPTVRVGVSSGIVAKLAHEFEYPRPPCAWFNTLGGKVLMVGLRAHLTFDVEDYTVDFFKRLLAVARLKGEVKAGHCSCEAQGKIIPIVIGRLPDGVCCAVPG